MSELISQNTENSDKSITVIDISDKKEREPREPREPTSSTSSTSLIKKKNPNRVAGGKKSVEARKQKAMLAEEKIKEAEILRKENIELKQREKKEITKDSHITSDSPDSHASLKGRESAGTASLDFVSTTSLKNSSYFRLGKDYKQLLYFTIGIGAFGLYVFGRYREHTCPKRIEKSEKGGNITLFHQEKKEIDPFEF